MLIPPDKLVGKIKASNQEFLVTMRRSGMKIRESLVATQFCMQESGNLGMIFVSL